MRSQRNPNQSHLRLDVEAYRQVCREILERDGWRCQECGSLQELEVHHMKFRSHGGSDVESNLVTLCHACHHRWHLL